MARGRPRGASCSTAATDETVRLAPKPSQGALVPVTSTENRNLVVLQRSPATNSPGMFREPLAHPIVGPRPVEAVGVPPLVLRQGGQHVLDKLLPRRPLPPFLVAPAKCLDQQPRLFSHEACAGVFRSEMIGPQVLQGGVPWPRIRRGRPRTHGRAGVERGRNLGQTR